MTSSACAASSMCRIFPGTGWFEKFFSMTPLQSNNPHAFALASVFPDGLPDTHEAAVVWKRFRECSQISDDCMIGAMAWCTGTPAQIRLGSRTICRGILLCDGGQGS